MPARRCLSRLSSLLLLVPSVLAAQAGEQPIDTAYTRQIRELTPKHARYNFTTELVDYLPASRVPTPLAVLGYVPGTIGRLSYSADVARYFKTVDEASTRVKLFSMGMSDEGREMIVAAIADDSVLAKLDEYRAMAARLADPRGLTPAERARLIRDAKPIYWLTGAIHSPETGSPEMLMELLYRLAVDEGQQARVIRGNVITLITPILEVDGRDKVVDVYRQAKSLGLGPRTGPLVYWGRYTAHDNNRDGMVLSQKLSQNYMRTFLHWRPTVGHDLHESVPFLYTSTGTGPYNDEFDPIVVDEWHTLAYQEITELTRRGLPGVWTHGFYDGWAPNYILAIANLHNSIGRFYETYTSQGADCHTVKLPAASTERRWDRPNPPVNDVRWCIRTNINYQQSGVLVALKYVADHAATFLENNVAKAERMIARGTRAAPYAYVVPRGQRRAAEAADLVNLLRAHGTEVHTASSDFTLKGDGSKAAADRAPTGTATTEVKAGDWIVRLDQPYTATARTLLAIQKYKPDDPTPYDDTGWTLDELRHVRTHAIADSSVLTRPMKRLTENAAVAGAISGTGDVLIVPHLGDWRSAVLPWKVAAGRVSVTDSAFSVGSITFPAGTFLLADASQRTRDALGALGLGATAVTRLPAVRRHLISLPRIALVHSWLETQNEGWVRYAFDQLGIPYKYISDQDLRSRGVLDAIDVVVFPHVSGAATALLNGRPMTGPAIPWKKTPRTPYLGGYDETDDIRPGMGLDGAAALRRFVERGGLLLTEGNSATLPIQLGFNTTVSVTATPRLQVRGSVVRAQQTVESPVLAGYENRTISVYFNQAPVLAVTPRDTTNLSEGVDTSVVNQTERDRARVLLRFHARADSLLVSGMLVAGEELAGRAAVVDAPVGKGHLLLFGIRPFWRWESQGSFALAINAIANWNALGDRVPSSLAPPPANVSVDGAAARSSSP
ncbi:MAG: M14 family zinc carboxypeptidase [Gemmatimonadaceae bacterium]